MIASSKGWMAGVVGSLFVHVMCARAAFLEQPQVTPQQQPMDVELVVRAPPPPVETPPPPPEPARPAPRPTAARLAPAQAGRVMDAAPAAPDATPADFSIVQGAANAYVGGVTRSNGTSTTPVAEVAAQPAAKAIQVVVTPASPSGSEWDCSSLYPAGTDESAAVLVRVHVDASGKPLTVTVLRDPGGGFAEAARACAMAQHYRAAHDSTGIALAGDTPQFVIRFHR